MRFAVAPPGSCRRRRSCSASRGTGSVTRRVHCAGFLRRGHVLGMDVRRARHPQPAPTANVREVRAGARLRTQRPAAVLRTFSWREPGLPSLGRRVRSPLSAPCGCSSIGRASGCHPEGPASIAGTRSVSPFAGAVLGLQNRGRRSDSVRALYALVPLDAGSDFLIPKHRVRFPAGAPVMPRSAIR